jgi:hypothetical protein
MTPSRAGTRWVFALSALLLSLYALNIALGIAAVKFGLDVWRLGDVGEFLLVLNCMIFFVVGLVADEERRARRLEEVVDVPIAKGGVQ